MIHIYTAPHESAMRYDANGGGSIRDSELWIEHKPNTKIYALCCEQKRAAKNLSVQVFYDSVRFWCVPGKGCKSPVETRRRASRIPRKKIIADYAFGLSCVGLARKYGLSSEKVQEIVRRITC